MAVGTIQRLIQLFQDVSLGLKVDCRCEELEHIVILVHRIMSWQSRQFHTLEHVFGFLDGADAQTSIAAVFHDLIYYQVDASIPPEVKDLVGSVVEETPAGIVLRKDIDAADRQLLVCRRLFGFAPGQTLVPFAGLNEFLSAVVMLRLLGGRLPEKALVASAICIEASIPFRGPNQAGRGMAGELEARLSALKAEGLIDAADRELRAMIDRAVAFANRDVQDFALADPARFLNNTWKLLPELNSSLRQSGAFTIGEYRGALAKMLGFFSYLDPATVYHEHRGNPDAAAMKSLTESARRNLSIASAYLAAKLLAIALLEAVCLETGKDAPVALFMGDVQQGDARPERLEDFLPQTPDAPWIVRGDVVHRLLEEGRLDESSFDLKNSPLALFIYRSLPPERRSRLDRLTDEFFKGRLSPSEYLAAWDPAVLKSVMLACSRLALTRKDAIEAWLARNML